MFYMLSHIIHHNNRVTVPLLSPFFSGGNFVPRYKWGNIRIYTNEKIVKDETMSEFRNGV